MINETQETTKGEMKFCVTIVSLGFNFCNLPEGMRQNGDGEQGLRSEVS